MTVQKHNFNLQPLYIDIQLSRFIYPMLPARLVLVVMCVCECACGRADASALINEPAIIIYTSCSSSDTLYILTTLSSPLSDRCLLSWTFGVPVFSPVRVRVGCAFQIRSRHFGCALDSSRHFRTPLHSTHLTIKVPSLLSWFCEPAPIFLTGGLIKSIYSHTVSAFLS